MGNFIKILNCEGVMDLVEVSDEVMTYIVALEFRINFPAESKLHEVYIGRFNEDRSLESGIDKEYVGQGRW